MTHAIRVHEHGGPEVLKWESVEVPRPGPGQALIRHRAVGLNFIEVYFRTGVYKPAQLPFIPGNEGAGEVIAVGEGVDSVRPGDRVAYAMAIGSYADERLIDADRLVKLPDGISDESAAAMMLKGMTACYLLRRTFPVSSKHTILFHAGAGGVGSIATQWAVALGATVITTVGSEEKAEIARQHGCQHVINYRTEDFVERVREITSGNGVDVVYDSIGQDAFPGSLDILRPMGMWVLFGQSSGLVPPIDMNMLAQKGSLFATRPTLGNYAAKREDLEALASELFDVVGSGKVRIEVNQTYSLSEAAQAHRDLEARKTTGATVLLP